MYLINLLAQKSAVSKHDSDSFKFIAYIVCPIQGIDGSGFSAHNTFDIRLNPLLHRSNLRFYKTIFRKLENNKFIWLWYKPFHVDFLRIHAD